MKLSETAIRRPVLASMLSAALVLFGVIGYTRLSVRELPDIDPPVISVSTVLPGANAQVVETAVTDVLEEELSTIQGIRTLSSTSAEQTSNITLEFTLDRPVDVAAQESRAFNPMTETADILFYEPLEDSYRQSRVLDLFKRLPVRMALFRIFASDDNT